IYYIAVFIQVIQTRHALSSKNKCLIFVNLYAQRFKKARSKSCPLQFVQPGIEFIEQPYIPGKSEYGSAPVLKKGNICRTEIPVPGVGHRQGQLIQNIGRRIRGCFAFRSEER